MADKQVAPKQASIAINLKFDSNGNLVAADPSKIVTWTGVGAPTGNEPSSADVGKLAVALSYHATVFGGVGIDETATATWTRLTGTNKPKTGGKSGGGKGSKGGGSKPSQSQTSTSQDTITVQSDTCVSYHKFSSGPDVMVCLSPTGPSVPLDKLTLGYHLGVPNTAAQINASFTTAIPGQKPVGTITVNIPLGKARLDFGASTNSTVSGGFSLPF